MFTVMKREMNVILEKYKAMAPLTHNLNNINSGRNKASPSGNEWLNFLRTDWFENLSDKLH